MRRSIEVAWRFYQALGVSGLSLQVNTLGDIDDRLRYRASLVEYFTPLRDRLCEDCQRRLEVNPLRLLDCKRDAGLVSGAPQIGPSLSAESQGFFTQVTDLLSAAAIPFSLNPSAVRGLHYYAHTTFELWHEFTRARRTRWGAAAATTGWPRRSASPRRPAAATPWGWSAPWRSAASRGWYRRRGATGGGPGRGAGGHARRRSGWPGELRAAGIAAVLDASERRLDRRLATAAARAPGQPCWWGRRRRPPAPRPGRT